MSEVPSIPQLDDLQELAAYYALNHAALEAFSKALWNAKRRLMEYVKDSGPIRTEHGLVGIEPDGWDWDDAAVAAAMPSLVSEMKLSIVGPQAEIEEVISTVAEMPHLTYEIGRRIDKVAAARVIREGGAPGEAVAACRSPKGKLGIRP